MNSTFNSRSLAADDWFLRAHSSRAVLAVTIILTIFVAGSSVIVARCYFQHIRANYKKGVQSQQPWTAYEISNQHSTRTPSLSAESQQRHRLAVGNFDTTHMHPTKQTMNNDSGSQSFPKLPVAAIKETLLDWSIHNQTVSFGRVEDSGIGKRRVELKKRN